MCSVGDHGWQSPLLTENSHVILFLKNIPCSGRLRDFIKGNHSKYWLSLCLYSKWLYPKAKIIFPKFYLQEVGINCQRVNPSKPICHCGIHASLLKSFHSIRTVRAIKIILLHYKISVMMISFFSSFEEIILSIRLKKSIFLQKKIDLKGCSNFKSWSAIYSSHDSTLNGIQEIMCR